MLARSRGIMYYTRQGSRQTAAARSGPVTRTRQAPPRLSGALGAAEVLSLQRSVGNQAVQLLIQRRTDESPAEGLASRAPIGVPIEKEAATADLSNRNAWGEIDGKVQTNVKPHLFTDGGKVGIGPVYWGGGDGGQGQQNVGSIDLIAPEYERTEPAAKDKPATAWVKPGTGEAKVTRSYKGVLNGDQGNGFYFSKGAVARADKHEVLHVKSSQGLHDSAIASLEKRVGQHAGQAKALEFGKTGAEAIDGLKAKVDWNASVTSFQKHDTAANQGGGSVDSTDMAQPDFVANYGPKKVKVNDIASYIGMPGEAIETLTCRFVCWHRRRPGNATSQSSYGSSR